MPKDLKSLIAKAKAAAGENGKKLVVEDETPDDPKEMAVKESSYVEESEGPDEVVQKHAEAEKLKELLEERDSRTKQGMTLLLSAADSVLSASRCREDQR